MSTIADRVEHGAALLDAKRPGWWQQIDLGRLNIESPCDCVIGQLGSYPETTRSLGLHISLDDWLHGFEGDEYAELTDAWRDLIQQRRLAQHPEPVAVPA
jgi:hypothetical protein